MARKCTRCGRENSNEGDFCMWCGRRLEPAAPADPQGNTTCPNCGHVNPSYSVFCGSCGGDLPRTSAMAQFTDQAAESWNQEPAYVDEVQDGRPPMGGVLTAGVILLYLCGLFSLGGGIFIAWVGNAFQAVDSSFGGTIELCGLITAVLGVASIGGGYFAMKQEGFTIAVIGAVCGMIGMFLAFGIIGLLVGIVTVVLVAMSRENFIS